MNICHAHAQENIKMQELPKNLKSPCALPSPRLPPPRSLVRCTSHYSYIIIPKLTFGILHKGVFQNTPLLWASFYGAAINVCHSFLTDEQVYGSLCKHSSYLKTGYFQFSPSLRNDETSLSEMLLCLHLCVSKTARGEIVTHF